VSSFSGEHYTYSEFKEEEKKTLNTAPEPKRLLRVAEVRRARHWAAQRRRELSLSAQPQLDYSKFKATVETAMQSAMATLKEEMAAQHEQTRAEVRSSRRDVLAAIKESPVEYVKILAEFGATFLVFCLALDLLLKIELVNKTFAVTMLIACGVYWSMALLKGRSTSSEKHPA
jgi:hypothetical protein